MYLSHFLCRYFSTNVYISEIDSIKNQITSAIEQMTMQGINLKSLDISKAAILNEKNDLNSEDGLLKEYKRLSIQLKQLQIIEKRSQTQIDSMKKEDITITDDIDRYNNLDVRYRSLILSKKSNLYLQLKDLYVCLFSFSNCRVSDQKLLSAWKQYHPNWRRLSIRNELLQT